MCFHDLLQEDECSCVRTALGAMVLQMASLDGSEAWWGFSAGI